jgi:hypothetical protein
VVIHDLDIFGAAGSPPEAHPKLIIDPDAVLPGAITLQGFEPIARRDPQVLQPAGDLKLPKLAASDYFNALKSSYSPPVREVLGLGALERHDHDNAARD